MTTTATFRQSNLDFQSSFDEGQELQESTGNKSGSSETFCNPQSLVPALMVPDPNTPSPNLNPVATGSVTPDAATKAALVKEENGEHLSHKERQPLYDYKIKAGLKQPPNKHNLERILAMKKNGEKLTPGQKTFLKRNSRRQGNNIEGSIAGGSDASTASVASTTEGSVLDGLVADGSIPDGSVVDEPSIGEQVTE
ncbi:MAG: hypothetical protein Q9210_001952 [Variospora velana]